MASPRRNPRTPGMSPSRRRRRTRRSRCSGTRSRARRAPPRGTCPYRRSRSRCPYRRRSGSQRFSIPLSPVVGVSHPALALFVQTDEPAHIQDAALPDDAARRERDVLGADSAVGALPAGELHANVCGRSARVVEPALALILASRRIGGTCRSTAARQARWSPCRSRGSVW